MDKPSTAIRGTLLIDGELVAHATVLVSKGRIAVAGRSDQVSVPDGVKVIDVADRYVLPGFIDILNHGWAGFRPEDDAVGMARKLIEVGTTCFLPSLVSNELPKMLEAADHVRTCTGPVDGGATIEGIHLEGPFFNPKYGMQRSQTNIEPDADSVRQFIEHCGNSLKMVTIAPERSGALEAIGAFCRAGATVAIGHSDADETEYLAGRRAGITHATHLFNAMSPKKWPTSATYDGTKLVGVEELILADDQISADIMCDLNAIHVNPVMMKIALKCKGPHRLALMSDSMLVGGLPPGEHLMADGQSAVTRPDDDIARLPDGTLCGGAMCLRDNVRNCMHHTGANLATAVTMATETPARVINIFDRKGSIAAGKDADLVVLDRQLQIAGVMVEGRICMPFDV